MTKTKHEKRAPEPSKERHKPPVREDAMWQAVVARDRRVDGEFLFSVRTTGIYCRPSCPARRPKRENVRFHRTIAEACAAGNRPCKRCTPDAAVQPDRMTEMITAACRQIEVSEVPPKLAALARTAGLSPHHFLRTFKSVTGVTPKAYASAVQAKAVRKGLNNGATVTNAILDAGYNSTGRFYAAANGILGMTPMAYRSGGTDSVIRYAVGRSALGCVLVAHTDKGICAITIGDEPAELVADLEKRFSRARLIAADADLAATLARVVKLVNEPRRAFDLPLDIRGTAFEQRVWAALRDIPLGKTATYTDVAVAIGRPTAARAVARACAANAIAVAIPCHRVVRSDGDLSGYRWGKERKRKLLAAEAGERPDVKRGGVSPARRARTAQP